MTAHQWLVLLVMGIVVIVIEIHNHRSMWQAHRSGQTFFTDHELVFEVMFYGCVFPLLTGVLLNYVGRTAGERDKVRGEVWHLPCAAAGASATVSNGMIHFTWTGEATNIYRLPDAPYATNGSAIASGQASPFAYSELLLGNESSNAFYLVGPSPSCGDRLGEFDFALVPGKP